MMTIRERFYMRLALAIDTWGTVGTLVLLHLKGDEYFVPFMIGMLSILGYQYYIFFKKVRNDTRNVSGDRSKAGGSYAHGSDQDDTWPNRTFRNGVGEVRGRH